MKKGESDWSKKEIDKAQNIYMDIMWTLMRKEKSLEINYQWHAFHVVLHLVILKKDKQINTQIQKS